jgi:hypothetical protein
LKQLTFISIPIEWIDHQWKKIGISTSQLKLNEQEERHDTITITNYTDACESHLYYDEGKWCFITYSDNLRNGETVENQLSNKEIEQQLNTIETFFQQYKNSLQKWIESLQWQEDLENVWESYWSYFEQFWLWDFLLTDQNGDIANYTFARWIIGDVTVKMKIPETVWNTQSIWEYGFYIDQNWRFYHNKWGNILSSEDAINILKLVWTKLWKLKQQQ